MKITLRAVLGAVLMLMAAMPAAADGANVGVRVGYYLDAEEPFLGVEYLAKVSDNVWFTPNIEYVLVDNARYVTLNADAHYDFYSRRDNFAYVGAGLALVSFNPEGPGDSDNELGLNLFGGLATKAGDVIPYLQVKALVVEGDTEFVIGAGLRF
jgi:hypothetical protein